MKDITTVPNPLNPSIKTFCWKVNELNCNIESPLARPKLLTNWSNNDPNNTIQLSQLRDFLENHRIEEPGNQLDSFWHWIQSLYSLNEFQVLNFNCASGSLNQTSNGIGLQVRVCGGSQGAQLFLVPARAEVAQWLTEAALPVTVLAWLRVSLTGCSHCYHNAT